MMKTVLVWGLSLVVMHSAWANEPAPQFKEYAAGAMYTGKNHALVLDDFSKMFKTRLNDAIQHGKPTFAGHYLVARWGCGSSGCNTGAVIDAKTGRAYPFPVSLSSVYPLKPAFENEDGQELIYKPASRLMIFAGNLESEKSDGSDVIEFYEMTPTGFKFIKSMPYGKAAP